MTRQANPETVWNLLFLLYGMLDRQIALDSKKAKALEAMHQRDERTLATLERLLTTGSESAKKEVAVVVQRIISILRIDRSFEKDAVPADFRTNMLRIWNSANVHNESGTTNPLDNLFEDLVELEAIIPELDESNGNADRDSYWRGESALAITRVLIDPEDTERRSQVQTFVEWAGNHPDIRSVIDLAIDRQSIDRELLDPILSGYSPLRNGQL